MSSALVASLLVLTLVPFVLCQDLEEPETVKELDVGKYLGRWYQVGAELCGFIPCEQIYMRRLWVNGANVLVVFRIG